MPRFKSNADIFNYSSESDVFLDSWMSGQKLVVPETKEWTYDREMNVDDVDIWEVIYEASGGIGVYASYCPFAEFYLICTGFTSPEPGATRHMETYYGPGSEKSVRARMEELGYPYALNDFFVDSDKLWLYN